LVKFEVFHSAEVTVYTDVEKFCVVIVH